VSRIDAGEPSQSARQAEAALARLDEWEAAYNVLRRHFETFSPHDVMVMLGYLRGE